MLKTHLEGIDTLRSWSYPGPGEKKRVVRTIKQTRRGRTIVTVTYLFWATPTFLC